jgi:hypothetical protein
VGNELCSEILDSEKDSLASSVIKEPLVQSWLNRLTLGDFPVVLDALNADTLGRLGEMVHGGKAECLENVLGKLAEFGLQAGMPGLDERVMPLMRIFRWTASWKTDATYQNAWETLVKSIFAWGLLRLGYAPDTAMRDFLINHLEICHKIARDRVFDIYAGEPDLVDLPKAWKGKPIIKQEVMANYWLPHIHDLYVFANYLANLLNETTSHLIDDIVGYILDSRFQAFHRGYGYAWIKERRTCYSWGWSPHLKDDNTFVQRLELMARFPRGRNSSWLINAIQSLECFRTPDGRYRLPPKYLREAEGYYVSGCRMSLGENRRRPIGIEVESTFWMLKIHSLLNCP